MHLRALPPAASWTHTGARTGFEVLFTREGRLRGRTAAHENDAIWYVGYEITIGTDWTTQTVSAVSSTIAADHELALTRSRDGRWTVNGVLRPDLDGCQDVDFESSAVTNTLPVHRTVRARWPG